MTPLPLLASKPGRRAWLRRCYKPSTMLPPRLAIGLRLVREAGTGLAKLGEEWRGDALLHIAAAYNTSMSVPGLRASQRMRMFYFLCDLLNMPSDSCYALGRLHLEWRREHLGTSTAQADATVSSLLRRIKSGS